MPVLLAAHALNLSQRPNVLVFVINIFILPRSVLLLLTTWSIEISLTTAPPHVIAILGSMDLARPIEVVFLVKVFATIDTKLGSHIHHLPLLHLLQFLFQRVPLVGDLGQ